jgi:hypothetical protein
VLRVISQKCPVDFCVSLPWPGRQPEPRSDIAQPGWDIARPGSGLTGRFSGTAAEPPNSTGRRSLAGSPLR